LVAAPTLSCAELRGVHREVEPKEARAPWVKRTRSTLRVGRAVLRDRSEEAHGDNMIRHAYVGRYPGLDVDLVRFGLWEGDGFLLVDPATGATADTAEAPVPAPGGGAFASASAAEGYNFHGIEVVERAAGGFLKTAEIEVADPCDLRWVSADRLSVRVRREGAAEAVWDEASVVRTEGGWSLLRAPR
jgi:hypothetical protein